MSADRRTTFLLAALAREQTGDITKDFVPELRDSLRAVDDAACRPARAST